MTIVARMDSNLVVRALNALAHESRLAIFRALVVAGPNGMPAGEIALQVGLAPLQPFVPSEATVHTQTW
jgi:ArsR family transcriptional regulator